MEDSIFFLNKAYLTDGDLQAIKALEDICVKADHITLKLELAYKQALSLENDTEKDVNQVSEFICIKGETVLGYLGLCGFDGMNLEINGMVHPDYRRKGIFSHLMTSALEEYRKRKEENLLLLCDSQSQSGQAFMNQMDASYDFSEYEMRFFLKDNKPVEGKNPLTFKKATNEDTMEIAKQNALYFGKSIEEIDMPLPETEEKRGLTVYLALLGKETVGKVNIQLTGQEAGLFGLGVKLEYRGKGYGRNIIQFAVSRAEVLKAKEVMLQVEAENEKALNLYTSSGFKVVSKMDYYLYRN